MIGYIAAILVTIAYLPQLYITIFITHKCALSWATLLILLTAMLLWTMHAMDCSDWSLFISSMLSFMQLFILSLYKIKKQRL